MDNITFMNEFIRKAKPRIPVHYAIKGEGRLLKEMDRQERLESTAHERKREETELKKIQEALLKEERDAYWAKKRHEQLWKNAVELRDLHSYIATAETASSLVGQLKLEEEIIEKRFKDAEERALELRAQYAATEKRQKEAEEKKHLEGKFLREHIIGQMRVHDMQRDEELAEKFKDGQELQARMNKLNEKDRLRQEANTKAKLELRNEILESLRKRQELFKLQNAKDMESINLQIETERKIDEKSQNIKDKRNANIEQRRAVSAMIGEKVLQIEKTKQQAISDLIDMFVNERQAKEEQAHQQELEKDEDTRRGLQKEAMNHFARKDAEKEREHKKNKEMASQRKPLTPDEQDRPRGKLLSRSKMLKTQQFMAEKLEIDREKLRRENEEIRQHYENLIKEAEIRDNEIETVKNEVLNKKPIKLLRFFPSAAIHSDYLPKELQEKVRQAVREDPIPMLTKRRHQPHLRGRHFDEPHPIQCSKICKNSYVISNIF